MIKALGVVLVGFVGSFLFQKVDIYTTKTYIQLREEQLRLSLTFK